MKTYSIISRDAVCVCCGARRAAARRSVSDRARALHNSALVFDGHVHAIDRDFYHGGDIGERHKRRPVRPAARQRGRTEGAVLLHLRHRGLLSGALRDQAGAAHAGYRARADSEEQRHHRMARNAADIERITKSGKIAAVLDIEGSFDLDGDPGVHPRDVPAGRALAATLGAQLDQQLCRFLLLAAEVARPERARPRSDPRDEPPRHGDQRLARFRRRHLAGGRRQQRSGDRDAPRPARLQRYSAQHAGLAC